MCLVLEIYPICLVPSLSSYFTYNQSWKSKRSIITNYVLHLSPCLFLSNAAIRSLGHNNYITQLLSYLNTGWRDWLEGIDEMLWFSLSSVNPTQNQIELRYEEERRNKHRIWR